MSEGNWMDEWGACKVCDGEIPSGHTVDCHIYKIERELAAVTAALSSTPSPVHKDTERLNWLEDYFSITAEESKPWREFESLVHQKGFRYAIDAELARTKGGK